MSNLGEDVLMYLFADDILDNNTVYQETLDNDSSSVKDHILQNMQDVHNLSSLKIICLPMTQMMIETAYLVKMM